MSIEEIAQLYFATREQARLNLFNRSDPRTVSFSMVEDEIRRILGLAAQDKAA